MILLWAESCPETENGFYAIMLKEEESRSKEIEDHWRHSRLNENDRAMHLMEFNVLTLVEITYN